MPSQENVMPDAPLQAKRSIPHPADFFSGLWVLTKARHQSVGATRSKYMSDIVITVTESGIRQIDAELTRETGRKTLQFLERLVPAMAELHQSARSIQPAQAPKRKVTNAR
jgi:hypothetical protein